MNPADLLARIAAEPGKMGGKPVIRGRRITPAMVLTMLAKGAGREAVLEAYPVLEPADIDACLLYAARLSEVASAQGLTIAAEYRAPPRGFRHWVQTVRRPRAARWNVVQCADRQVRLIFALPSSSYRRKAGIHRSNARVAKEWAPACAEATTGGSDLIDKTYRSGHLVDERPLDAGERALLAKICRYGSTVRSCGNTGGPTCQVGPRLAILPPPMMLVPLISQSPTAPFEF